MNDDQLQAWLDQHGGEVGRKDNEKEVEDGSFNPQTGTPNKKKTVDSTTITAKDGATLTIRRDTSGSGSTYQVIENTPPKQTASGQPNQPARTPAQIRQEAEDERERDFNQGQTGLRETHLERRTREAKEKKDAEDRARADADRNKPTTTIRENPDGTVVAVQTFPDNRTPVVTPIPGVRGKPDTVKGPDGVTYERQPDGTYKPAAGIAAPTKGGKLPPGVKPPQFSRGNVATELTRFNQELDAAVSRGEISKEDATGFYTTYHQAAQTFLSEQNNSDSQDATASGQQLTQRSQNMTQAGNRLNWANSAFQNAANADQQMLLGAGTTGKSALVPLLTLQAGLANAAGGLRDQPEVEVRRYPASIQPVAAATNAAAPAAGGKPAPLINPTQPVSAAQASAVAAQARARDAGGVPTPGEPGGPPLATPQPSPVPTPPPNAAASAATPTPADGNERDDDILTVQGQQGAAQQMTRAEYNALPANVRGSVVVTNAQPNPARFQQPAEQPPANGGWSEPTPAPAGSPTWDTYRPTPGSAPADPAFPDPTKPPLPPNEVTMAPPMPRSIQAAMPSAPGTPDIDSIAERMLADGADPMDVMEIRRRWKRGAAA